MAEPVRLERDGAGITRVILSRPPANAVDGEVMAALREIAESLSMDASVRAVILTSEVPRFFAAGADLSMLDAGWDRMLGTIRAFHEVGNAWERIPAPTIAAINGIAAGAGCEMALACDFRIMADGARIGCPEVKLGLIASGGGTQRLPRLLGRGPALQLLLRGTLIGADEALRIGLVTETCPAGDLLSRATALAAELAALPPLAVRETKRCVVAGLDGPLAAGLALEERANVFLAGTADAREGVSAFVHRRPPVFEGR